MYKHSQHLASCNQTINNEKVVACRIEHKILAESGLATQ